MKELEQTKNWTRLVSLSCLKTVGSATLFFRCSKRNDNKRDRTMNKTYSSFFTIQVCCYVYMKVESRLLKVGFRNSRYNIFLINTSSRD